MQIMFQLVQVKANGLLGVFRRKLLGDSEISMSKNVSVSKIRSQLNRNFQNQSCSYTSGRDEQRRGKKRWLEFHVW